MVADLNSQIMAILSERLTTSVADLAQALSRPDSEIAAAVQSLEREQQVRLTADYVTKNTLLSPTPKGLLKARGLA